MPRLDHLKYEKDIILLIKNAPGIQEIDIVRNVHASHNTVVYTLRKLMKDRTVVKIKNGQYCHYFLNGAVSESDKKRIIVLKDTTRMIVFKAIQDLKYSGWDSISKKVGITPSSIQWHVKKLSDAGLVKVIRENRTVKIVPL